MSEILEAPARPVFANFVGGEWAESSSGETYEKRGPWRPSEPIGAFPASGEADVDRAVAAARDAFPAWADLPAAQRGAVLARTADAVDRRVEQIAQDMTLEMGKPIREARLEAARMAQILRFFAGEGLSVDRRALRAGGDRKCRLHDPPPARRGRADHAVELPGRDPRVEGGAGARVRKHRRHEARAGGAAHRAPPRGVLRRGRHATRRVQRRHRAGLGRGHAARGTPGRARDLLHRLGAGRRAGARRGHRARQARAARARRPQPRDRHGGRRPRPCGGARVRRRLLVGGPEVHRHAPRLRRGLGVRRLQVALAGEDGAWRGRRPDRSGDRGRPDRQREPAHGGARRDRPRPGRRRDPAGGRRAAGRGGLSARAGALRGPRRTTHSSPARRCSAP